MSALDDNVRARFGIIPNFFQLAASDPNITRNLWGFAQFAYLDNPLPPVFKERLFVYVSRFCEIRYCIARHVGFLVGLGRPAGDPDCLPQTMEAVLPLLRSPLPHGQELTASIACLATLERPITSFPGPDMEAERALFACATHVFLQTRDAPRAHEALRGVLNPVHLEHLNVFLAFVRTAHYWTKLHPELRFEEDINQLLAAHEALAECILNDPAAQADSLSRQVAEDLASLQELRNQNATMVKAYENLAIDHRNVKESLRDSEANLRELIGTMPAAVYACDARGRLVYYNKQAIALWGDKPEPGTLAWSFLQARLRRPDDPPLLTDDELPVRTVLITGSPVINRELIFERADGSRVDVLVNIAPLRDAERRISGAINIVQDISGIKRAQREREQLLHELERSNQELSQFSHVVSHDLLSPINNVCALIRLLGQRVHTDPDGVEELITLIIKASQGMQDLVTSLLHYAEVGHATLRRQRVAADGIVDAVRLALASLMTEHRARILSAGLPVIDADPVLIEQVLQNLVANAIKYHRSGEPPVVEIRGGALLH